MRAILSILHTAMVDMTVQDFVRNMKILDALNDTLSIPSFKGNGTCTVYDLDEVSFGLAKARTIPCRFYGGPPQGHALYTGTLLTMFIDRLLTITFIQHFMAIERFLPSKIVAQQLTTLFNVLRL